MERLEVEIVAGISGLEKSLNAAQAKLEKFGQAATKLGTAFSVGLSVPITAFGVASVKAFGDIQALKNGLAAVTGSAGEAAKQFDRLKIVAKLPGLGLEEAVKGSINLQTIGFTAERAEKSMQAFGNAVATVGGGKDEFARALYGLQQLANTDFPLGEDLNILKDAIPQVTPLLKDAFGTARTADLQKLGITSAQVVDTIISGLSKLPSVTGGVNGAFENFGDGVKNNLAKVGESINNAFNISGIVDKFVESLGNVVDAFTGLSPQAQKIILIIAGIVAAIGPVILAFGVFSTTVIPALTAGLAVLGGAFAAITGPIALIVVAVGAAVYLIIKHWDDVVAYFTKGKGAGVFSALAQTFNDGIAAIKVVWATFTKYLSDFWNSWGNTITFVAKKIFDNVLSVFKIAFELISNAFKIFTAVLTGRWSDIGPILLDTTKRIWNGVLSIITNVIQIAGSLVSKLFENIGLNSISDKINSITNTIQSKLSFDIPIKVDPGNKAVTDATTVTEEVRKAVVPIVKGLSKEIQDVYNDLNKALLKNPLQFGATHLDVEEANIKSYQKAIDGLIENGYKPESKAVQDLINKQKEYIDVKSLKIATPDQIKQTVPQALSLPQIPIANLQSPVAPLIDKLNTDFEKLSQTILQNGVTEAFATLGQSIGSALSSGGNLMQTLGAGLLSVIGNIATQLGKAAIGVGVAMIGIKNAFSNPLTAIAAGVALIAIGAFISSKVANMTKGENGTSSTTAAPIPQFANGGIISGPTVGLMGEYSGARSNPEVVAPLNKLKGMLPKNSEESTILPDLRLRGEDIYVMFKRVSKRLG